MRSSLLAGCFLMALGATPSLVSCGGEPNTEPAASGTLSVPLSAVTPNGVQYRLSNASFQVTGGTLAAPLTLSSNTDPTTATITSTLGTGNYSIALGTGWQMQRLDASGQPTSVNALLVSQATQAFSIADQVTTRVTYQFNVQGTIVQTGQGTLEVAMEVNEITTPGGYYLLGSVHGYAWTSMSTGSTMSPTSFTNVVGAGPYCVSGSVAGDATYGGFAQLGINVNQGMDAGSPVGQLAPSAAGSQSLGYDVRQLGSSPLRIQLYAADGTYYCANLAAGAGAGTIPWTSFNTQCWPGGNGVAYAATTPLTSVAVMVAGSTTATPFNFCLNSISF